MANIEGFAEVVTPQARGGALGAARKLEEGAGKKARGDRTVKDVLQEMGKENSFKAVLSSPIRETLYKLAELTGETSWHEIADQGYVLVDISHLRKQHPNTVVAIGCDLSLTEAESRALGMGADPSDTSPRAWS